MFEENKIHSGLLTPEGRDEVNRQYFKYKEDYTKQEFKKYYSKLVKEQYYKENPDRKTKLSKIKEDTEEELYGQMSTDNKGAGGNILSIGGKIVSGFGMFLLGTVISIIDAFEKKVQNYWEIS